MSVSQPQSPRACKQTITIATGAETGEAPPSMIRPHIGNTFIASFYFNFMSLIAFHQENIKKSYHQGNTFIVQSVVVFKHLKQLVFYITQGLKYII